MHRIHPRRRLALCALIGAFLLPLPTGVQADPPADPHPIDALLDTARSCVAGLAASGVWTRDTPPAVDWLDRERWCRTTPGEVEGHALPCDPPVSDLLTLRVERDPERHEDVRRLALNLSLAGADGGWTVAFYGTVNRLEPGSPLGEHVYGLATVTVTRTRPDGQSESLSLTRASFEVGDRAILAPGEYLAPEDLRARFSSPETLRDALLDQQDVLHEQVTGLLDRGQMSLCPEPDAADRFQCGPMGDGEGHAMYDTCVRRGLTAQETADARARLDAEVEARRSLILRDYEAIHAAVTRALADDSCWLLDVRLVAD